MIRRAILKDIEQIVNLLKQVQKVHYEGRPDIFVGGARKYTDEELKNIILDEKTPVFVFEENNKILGYVFCIITVTSNSNSLKDRTTIYIDDLCVDSNCRGRGIGTKLFEFVAEIVKESQYDGITLNVWNFNEPAMNFYKRLGMTPLKTIMEYNIKG